MSPRRPRVVSRRPSICVRPTDGRMSQSSLQGSGIFRSVYNTVVRRIEKKGRERERERETDRQTERDGRPKKRVASIKLRRQTQDSLSSQANKKHGEALMFTTSRDRKICTACTFTSYYTQFVDIHWIYGHFDSNTISFMDKDQWEVHSIDKVQHWRIRYRNSAYRCISRPLQRVMTLFQATNSSISRLTGASL